MDLKLRNKLHGPMHYKIGVTCVFNGHEILCCNTTSLIHPFHNSTVRVTNSRVSGQCLYIILFTEASFIWLKYKDNHYHQLLQFMPPLPPPSFNFQAKISGTNQQGLAASINRPANLWNTLSSQQQHRLNEWLNNYCEQQLWMWNIKGNNIMVHVTSNF